MAYSDLQFNQTISFNNLQSGVTQGYFVAKTSIPVSAKQITKAEANTYVNINTSLPSYADKASNQLVTREDLQGATGVFPYTIYALADTGGGGGDPYYAWKSIDGGNNFNQLTGLSSSVNWTEIAGDTSGTYVAVVDKSISNQVYISSNSGATFSAVSLNSANFYPYGVAMSNNGQYIAVSGFNIVIDNATTGYAKIAISTNYGASFTTTYVDGTLRPYGFQSFTSTGKISISGDGQRVTAVFGYAEFVGFPYFYTRPVSFKVTSNNYGASWTTSGTTPFAFFQGIALSDTGQYQFLTGGWYDKNAVSSSGWDIGAKGYTSSDYGSTWTERFYDEVLVGDTYSVFGLALAGISASGSSMVAATSPFDSVTITRRYASSNYGSSFSIYAGVTAQQGLSVGLTPVSGITNSYATIFTPNSTMYYSTDGGFTAWYPKEITTRFFRHIYRKALNTPELPYSYTLYYNNTVSLPAVNGFNSALDACDLATNSFTVYSTSSSIGVGTALYYDVYGITQIQANPSSDPSLNYYKIGSNSIQFSNNYIIDSVVSCSPAYTTYYADEYECDGIDCAYVQSNVLVVLPTSFTPDYTKYYLLQAGGPRIFFLDTTTTGVGLILSTTNYNSCLEICGV
jgi:hypothetical protein